MTEGLHLASGHVIISRDIVMEDATGKVTVGILNHFERFGRMWIDVQLNLTHLGLGYEATAVKIALDRFTEMKIPTVSVRIDNDDSYMGTILHGLGFIVFQASGGSVLLEKHLL